MATLRMMDGLIYECDAFEVCSSGVNDSVESTPLNVL